MQKAKKERIDVQSVKYIQLGNVLYGEGSNIAYDMCSTLQLDTGHVYSLQYAAVVYGCGRVGLASIEVAQNGNLLPSSMSCATVMPGQVTTLNNVAIINTIGESSAVTVNLVNNSPCCLHLQAVNVFVTMIH